MKFLKWLMGILAGIIGIITILFGNRGNIQKKKEIKDQIKDLDKEIDNIKDENNAVKKSLENKKKALEEMEKQKTNFKPKNVGAKEADKYIRDLLKKRKK